MENKEFQRKHKEVKPVLAICYDFDKTLSPDDMQAQGYIQSIDYDTKEFWEESNRLAADNDMDQNLAYMYKMVEGAYGRLIFNKAKLAEYGSKVELFPGVVDWFERIRQYGAKQGIIVEHYIISSGLKEMIEGTEMAQNGAFEKIYASSFYYDDRGVAKWPAQAVNYTNKTQFLFRIEKGFLDINDPGVNEYIPQNQLRVPFRNMVYIGDSDTDIPCMKLVNANGGHSIGVYNPETMDKTKVYRMMNDSRIKFFAPADYSEGAELDQLVKSIIDRTAANEHLENLHYMHQKETNDANKADQRDEKEQRKDDLIAALANSYNFANSHTLIKNLVVYTDWTNEQKERLLDTAIYNQQIRWILKDLDIANFYRRLLTGNLPDTPNAAKVKEILESDLSDE